MPKKIILIICILVTYSFGVSEGAVLLDRIMAIVNKEVITWSELYEAMEFEASGELKALNEQERRRVFKESESVFLENMIDMKLQIQEAKKLGISASEEDVNRAIENIKKKYSMTEEMFREAVKREGLSIPAYRKKLAEQITISRIVDQEVRSKVLVTEKEIDVYISENKEAAKEIEGVVLSHIFLNKTEDKKQVEEKARDLYRRIMSSENFSDIARQYSEDASARSGGSIGFIKKADISKEFMDVLAKLEVGNISEPFWGSSGMHIIRLDEKIEIKTREDLREMIRQRLLDEKFKKAYKDWTKTLRERAYVEIKL